MKKVFLFTLLIATMALTAWSGVPERQRSHYRMRTLSPTHQVRESMPEAVQLAATAPEGALEVPFAHTMGKNDAETALWAIVDANNDSRTWKTSLSTAIVCMKPNTEGVTAMDDWLISPPIHMLAGENYVLTFETSGALSSSQEEKLEVKMGTSPEIEALTTSVVDTYTFLGNSYTNKEAVITVEADGYYYIGFHGISETEKSGNIRLRNVAMASKNAAELDPPAAGKLSYVLAPKGELRATVTYTAPTLTKSGKTLERITKVEVKSAWGYDTKTITDIAPGESRTFDMKMLQGGSNNRFEATAYIDDAAGETLVVKNIYCGMDNPLPPTNVTATLSADFKQVTVSWDPVGEVGENGGYVDVENVNYYIFDAFGSYYDPAIASTTATSYTFDYSHLTEQDVVAFEVTAAYSTETTDFVSLSNVSSMVFPGPADATPWKESFANTDIHNLLIVDPESQGQFVINYPIDDTSIETEDGGFLTSQDRDNGFFLFLPYEKDASYGFLTGKIDIKGLANPIIEFFYQGKGSVLDVLLSSGGEWELASSIDLKEYPTEGWTQAQVDLSTFASAGYIQAKFRVRAIHNDDEHTWSVLLDNIRVRDLVDTDLAIASVSAPEKGKAGSPITIKATVENLGNATAAGVVTLASAGKVVAQQAFNYLYPYSVDIFELQDTLTITDPLTKEYTVSVVMEGDQCAANDNATISVAVVMPAHPTATEVTATATDATVSLSWTAPQYQDLMAATTRVEDFESEDYTPFTIEDFGGWTMVDVDKKKTYTFMNDVNNPYRTMPMAFQLYTPTASGMPTDYLIDCTPHSGNTMLVGWSAQGVNDNWLISPALSGNAQTISFWALGFTIAYPESFEVLYSTTTTDIAAFTRIDTVENYPANGIVPEVWTEYKATLPEGAKYFAVRMTSNDSYALYLDDFTFEAGGTLPADTELVGYNIYRNGNKLNSTPVAETSFVDATIKESGNYTYGVSAVYNNAESALSETVVVKIDASGIAAIDSDNNAPVEYFNLQGIGIERPASGTIVIRRQGSKVTKEIIK